MLISNMLRDDPKLQKCLVSDQAHVTPGSIGPHVAKIQSALLALDNAVITLSELRSKTYGASTTAAVLTYKRKRKIINPAYQVQADNIVGRMTIASLDKELLALDKQPIKTAFCGHGAAAEPLAIRSASSSEAALVGKPPTPHKHHFKQFRLVFQITSVADAMGGFNFLDDLWNRARFLMSPYRMSFASERPQKAHILPHDQIVNVNFISEQFSILRLSELADPGFQDTLRVIFCPFDPDKNPYYGITCGGKGALDAQHDKPKFVLINSWLRHKDSGTLLHEMIHAADPDYSEEDKHEKRNRRSVFSVSDDGRDQLLDVDAEALSRAYFA